MTVTRRPEIADLPPSHVMSTTKPNHAADNLPPTARAIALLLSSTPSVQDAQPGVLHQLLEFANRYTMQVLTDAKVYAEHAGRSGTNTGAGSGVGESKVDMADVVLAVQSRVGWEFGGGGGRVPQEYILSLATQTNAQPLPPVNEVFGVRAPSVEECLTSVDFDLVPNKPPVGVKLYDEEVEEIEETESESESEEDDEDMDMERADIPTATATAPTPMAAPDVGGEQESAPFPISAIASQADVEMMTPGGGDEGSDGGDGDEDGLFAGGDDEDEDSEGMEEVQDALDGASSAGGGVKRKLQEDDDYD